MPRRGAWPGRAVCALLAALPALNGPSPRVAADDDPFAVLRPWVEITPRDRARVDAGEPLIRVLPTRGQEVAILAVSTIQTEPDLFAGHVRAIEHLRRGARVRAIRRFSSPPILSDLADLSLDVRELDSIRRCRPGNCGQKLAAADMRRLQQAAAAAGTGWQDALQREFRGVVLDRVNHYLAGGLEALPAYDDKQDPVPMAGVFTRLMEHSPYIAARLPPLARVLAGAPARTAGPAESFTYWSHEQLDGKPIVTATQVTILRLDSETNQPLVVVAGQQLFASHYTNGALSLTLLVGHETRYLLYLIRSEVDLLGGLFGPWKRAILEGRIKRDAGSMLATMRKRLEAPLTEERP